MTYMTDSDFCEWYALYPLKKARPIAYRAWKKCDRPSMNEMIAILEDQIANESKWKQGFIPMPATYLNQRRFEDELTPEIKPDNCITRAKRIIQSRPNGQFVDTLAGTLF